jgi:hypothetical protein
MDTGGYKREKKRRPIAWAAFYNKQQINTYLYKYRRISLLHVQ